MGGEGQAQEDGLQAIGRDRPCWVNSCRASLLSLPHPLCQACILPLPHENAEEPHELDAQDSSSCLSPSSLITLERLPSSSFPLLLPTAQPRPGLPRYCNSLPAGLCAPHFSHPAAPCLPGTIRSLSSSSTDSLSNYLRESQVRTLPAV